MIPLTRGTKVVKFTQRRSGTVLGEGRGVGELVFNGSRGSAWEKQKVPEMDNGDGHTMRMYLMTLNAALKRSENGKLYAVYISPQ